MKIIISGYGRMGHEIEKAAIGRGHRIVAVADNVNDWENILLTSETCDVVIDFSTPDSSSLIVRKCLNAGIPVVSGTTGWLNGLAEVEDICKSKGGSFFYAPNFSIGVNIFFEINRQLARLLSGRSYTPGLSEIHHIHKLDSPSGTAIALANDIIAANPFYKEWKSGKSTGENVLSVFSERTGEVPGTHFVVWESDADAIEIRHTAFNRKGFASGAVLAAEWLPGRTGVFGMADLLDSEQ
ncbi:MAG: 4-hydroxy-tetrahydrodipicolinate reductase [Bacteroidales bacterium]|nr:4-hydroxy-tetrahydrodipicolinate reductase [Bacteroidales bacterium]